MEQREQRGGLKADPCRQNPRWCSAMPKGWGCHQHTGAAAHLQGDGIGGQGKSVPIAPVGRAARWSPRGTITALQGREITLHSQASLLQLAAGWPPHAHTSPPDLGNPWAVVMAASGMVRWHLP